MMLKAIGSCLLILGFAFIGIYVSEKMKSRIKNIETLSSFVEFITVNIKTYRMPLREIFDSARACGSFPERFVNGLNNGIYTAAQKAGLINSDEEGKILKRFDEELGSEYAETTIKQCENCINSLAKLLEKLQCDYPEKTRLYRSISLIAGVSVVIMLL